jgi:hypothetical protein
VPLARTPHGGSPHAAFEQLPHSDGSETGSFLPGDFEAQYEQLFAEALEEGEITPEERQRLNLAAAALGLDAERVMRVETALLAAYEAGAAITLAERADPGSLADVEWSTRPPEPSGFDDLPTPIARPLVRDPDDMLHERFLAAARGGERDLQFRLAAVLVQHKRASPEERDLYDAYRRTTPPRPTTALTSEGWKRLFHPEEDRTTGDIFAVIASAALLGRVSAMRRDRSLPQLDPNKRQDAATSTVSAVRAVAWASATLGIRQPPVYVAPEEASGFDIITAVPPALRIGAAVLSGQTAIQLAFHCGRHLTWLREEHFVCTLVPSIPYLEDLFLAALSIAAPDITLTPAVRKRIGLVAEAIVPVLEPVRLERLQRQVARFLAKGGRTSLRQWAQSAEWTALRAGLLLCGDLATACDLVSPEAKGADRVRELETFWAGEDATALRKMLGVAIPPA